MEKRLEEGLEYRSLVNEKVMCKLDLRVRACKVTSKRKSSDRAVIERPIIGPIRTSITLAKIRFELGDCLPCTGESTMYLAVAMNFYSRRIIGWQVSKCMVTDRVR